MNFKLADSGYARTKVRQERIWVEAVDRENKAAVEWQDRWSFLADYDPKVRIFHYRNLIIKKTLMSQFDKSKSIAVDGNL